VRHELEGWRSAQARGPDGTIESDERVQAARTVVPSTEEGARCLGDRYWREVAYASGGLVRVRWTAAGPELRLLGRGPRLLRFAPAETVHVPGCVSCRFEILGGVLAQRPGGALELSQTGEDEPELRAAVTGFVPRLGLRPGSPRWSGALYDHVQRRLHVAISRRYFRRLIEEAAS
jgi:hypothetical protein